MKVEKSEKILIGISLILTSFIILYNLFYVPHIPNLDITKKEINFQNKDEENKIIPDYLININSASHEMLTMIPGVGSVTAKKIIEYREENGGFEDIKELMNISGIGKKKFKKMRDYVKI